MVKKLFASHLLTQGLNLCLLHHRWILYPWATREAYKSLEEWICGSYFSQIICEKEFPVRRLQTNSGPWPVRKQTAQQEVSGEWAKLYLSLQLLPNTCITDRAPPPVRSVAALDSHGSSNPTLSCTCEGSRLQAPYENHPKTMPTASVHEKKSLPQNWSLEPKMFRTADLK